MQCKSVITGHPVPNVRMPGHLQVRPPPPPPFPWPHLPSPPTFRPTNRPPVQPAPPHRDCHVCLPPSRHPFCLRHSVGRCLHSTPRHLKSNWHRPAAATAWHWCGPSDCVFVFRCTTNQVCLYSHPISWTHWFILNFIQGLVLTLVYPVPSAESHWLLNKVIYNTSRDYYPLWQVRHTFNFSNIKIISLFSGKKS